MGTKGGNMCICQWVGDLGGRVETWASPEGRVYLQGLRQHLGPDVLHAVATQIHLGQAGVAAQGIDEDAGAKLQPGVRHGQRLQGLSGQKEVRLNLHHHPPELPPRPGHSHSPLPGSTAPACEGSLPESCREMGVRGGGEGDRDMLLEKERGGQREPRKPPGGEGAGGEHSQPWGVTGDGAGSVGTGWGSLGLDIEVLSQEQVLEGFVLAQCRHQCQEV